MSDHRKLLLVLDAMGVIYPVKDDVADLLVPYVSRQGGAPAKVVEECYREASLGNITPHVHWHVIARFEWDSRWPGPIWAPATRELGPPDPVDRLGMGLEALDARVARAVAALAPGR